MIEIQRRVLIPETLIELYESQPDLGEALTARLKSVQTSYRKAIAGRKVYKFSDEKIKEFRNLLSADEAGGNAGWFRYCETFLAPQLRVVWDEVVVLCNLNFIKVPAGERHPLLTAPVSWDGVTELMGRYGLGSADAMILDLVLSTKIALVPTADGDIQYLHEELRRNGKSVLGVLP